MNIKAQMKTAGNFYVLPKADYLKTKYRGSWNDKWGG